ncbi:MAG: transcriptional regulator, family [Actinomycetia bacterium]|nr:transcriptional regulator, family [Actinomycetes bacterium]
MPGPGNVGERVRNLRLTRRLSQAQLAAHDLSDSYISLIESGKRTPTPAVLRLLAERLGCTAEYLADGVEPEQRAHLEVRERHARLERLNGDPEAALSIFDEVIIRSDDPELTLRARWGRACALEDLGELEAAIEVFEELREQAERDPGRSSWLPSVISLARCYHAVGDLGQAIALGERALARLGELGLTTGREHAEAGRVLMLAYVDRCDLERARDLGRRALSVDDTPDTSAYRAASVFALENGAIGDALHLADRAIAAHDEDTARLPHARLGVAGARALLRGVASYGTEPSGQDSDLTSAQEALALLRDAAPRLSGVDATECTIETARALVLMGKLDQAVDTTEQTLTELGQGHALGSVQARLVLARARLAQDDRIGALSELRSTATELKRLPHGRTSARASRELGDLLDAAGDSAGATAAYRRALEAAGLRPSVRPQQNAPADLAEF